MKHPPEHTRELLSRLGNPQEGIKIIHVAGTNGKGSVCAYLNAMLLAGGKKTGLFTSPHLVRINERFQINGEDVSDEQFLDAFLKVEKAAKEYEAEGEGPIPANNRILRYEKGLSVTENGGPRRFSRQTAVHFVCVSPQR